MKINFYPIRQFDAASAGAGAALGAAGPVGAAISVAELAIGLTQAISGAGKSKRARGKRRAFKTPEEIFKLLRATESIQGGLSPDTLSYISGGDDNALSSSLSAATRLGADPNQLSELLDRRIQSTFKLGAENQLQNMKNFGSYIGALGLVAENKAAEQKSQQDIIKDELQAASAMQQQGGQRIDTGFNTELSVASAYDTAKLYRERTNAMTGNPLPAPVNTAATTIPSSIPTAGGIIADRRTPDATYNMSIEQILDLLNKIKIGG